MFDAPYKVRCIVESAIKDGHKRMSINQTKTIEMLIKHMKIMQLQPIIVLEKNITILSYKVGEMIIHLEKV